MTSYRVRSLAEARSGAVPRVRQKPNERAHVLPGDPPYLHAGKTFRLLVHGESTDLFPIGALARGLGRSVGTVRRLEEIGVLKTTPLRYPGRVPAGQPRLYTRQQVLAVVEHFRELSLLGKHPQCWRARVSRPI